MIKTLSLFGESVSLYYLCWMLAVIVAFIVGYTVREQYGFSFEKCTAYIAFDAVFGVLFIFGTSWLYGGGRLNGINFVRIVPLLWVYFWLLARLLKDPCENVFDMLTIVGAFLFVVARFGCVFVGCCHGYPAEWGLYSDEAKTVCFPIQLVEMAVGILIALVLLRISKDPKAKGKMYPYYLIMFGSTRFVLEFLRDNDKLFWQISELALHALAAFFLGVAIMKMQKRKEGNQRNERR